MAAYPDPAGGNTMGLKAIILIVMPGVAARVHDAYVAWRGRVTTIRYEFVQ